jgi:hypothetical protein
MEKYIEGTEPLSLAEQLHKVGFDLDDRTGKLSISPTPTEQQQQLQKFWLNP